MADRAELWRALVALDVPHINHITHERKKIVGANVEVGRAFRDGLLNSVGAERCYAQTKNGSYTSAIWRPEKGPVPEVVVWWSYRTPIALLVPGFSMCLRSSYSYSNTTNRHQCCVVTSNLPETLQWNGHIGAGMLTVETMLRTTEELYETAVRSIGKRRKPDTWLAAIYHHAEKLHTYCDILCVAHKARPVAEMLAGNDKLLAKMTGWVLRHEEAARKIREINQLVTEHGISS